ncbi:MAG TPA: hypothetical protein V6D10_07525 [Trichocoleus sp.]|jgi:hypothetical protein
MYRTLYQTALLTLILSPAAIAATQITIESDTAAFQNQVISEGTIRVEASYEPIDYDQLDENSQNLRYQIYYNDEPEINAGTLTDKSGGITLQDLDQDGVAEVIVDSFSGGAHCCTSFAIYHWQDDQFKVAELNMLNGRGGTFKDLDGDGTIELVSYDNSFLYAFSSYAGSSPPSLIFNLRNGELVDSTRQYPDELRAVAWQMYQTVQEVEQNEGEMNGVLAGYVAQKILLGEFEEGWNFMMARYDRNSDWGLDHYENGEMVGRYPDFPTALKALLINRHYLNAAGQPD